MARAGAMPDSLGRVHHRFLTPHVSTIVIGLLATLWYVPLNLISENFLFDTLSALSLMIAFYYALSGFACVIYYRHELTRSLRNFLFIGVAPLVGALLLDLADERGARMIVVGTYGESPLRGAVLGSTPHKLLHLSGVPVLAVPAGRTSAG